MNFGVCVLIGFVILMVVGFMLDHARINNAKKEAIRQAQLRDSAMLARQRITYINQLRCALRRCMAMYGCDYTVEGKKLQEHIKVLVTAVDTNGQPLHLRKEKQDYELY